MTLDSDGSLVDPPLEKRDQWLQLECHNDIWMDILADRPVQADDCRRQHAVQAMRAAARWTARYPDHPALAEMRTALDAEPLFLMLSPRVLWHYSFKGEWILPGLGGGLYIEGNWPAVPEYAENDELDVAGLLGLAFEDGPWGLTWVRLVLWPLPHDEVARMIAGCTP